MSQSWPERNRSSSRAWPGLMSFISRSCSLAKRRAICSYIGSMRFTWLQLRQKRVKRQKASTRASTSHAACLPCPTRRAESSRWLPAIQAAWLTPPQLITSWLRVWRFDLYFQRHLHQARDGHCYGLQGIAPRIAQCDVLAHGCMLSFAVASFTKPL